VKKFKKLEEHIFKTLSAIATYSLIGILLFIIVLIIIKGINALNIEIITSPPKGGYYYGGDGGILNAILGSLYLAFGATLVAACISIPATLFINVHLVRRKRSQLVIRYLLDALWGIPSIVYGAFGFTLMLFIGMHASLIAGIFTVALLITPILIRTFDEVCSTIPLELQETSFALGATRTETSFKIILKQGFSGLITAIILAFGRGVGDAASVLFTAGYTDLIPGRITDPAATLPLAIFFQLGSPIPEVRERAYAAAIVLTILVLILSILARLLTYQYSKKRLK
jgi:phosphate transport system permease protein